MEKIRRTADSPGAGFREIAEPKRRRECQAVGKCRATMADPAADSRAKKMCFGRKEPERGPIVARSAPGTKFGALREG